MMLITTESVAALLELCKSANAERQCPYCNRKFTDDEARFSHAKAKHPGKSLRDITPERVKAKSRAQQHHRDKHESLADIAIAASIKRACGEPLDILEESLLP